MIQSLYIKPQTSFYHAYNEDIATINNIEYKSRINRIVSLQTNMINSVTVQYNLDMFNRTLKGEHFTQTEKDFWNDLAYIYDQVVFSVNDTGKVISLNNYNEIIKKQQSTIDEIKLSFRGIEIDSVIKQMTFASRESKILARHLLQYKMYGLFFMGLYGQVYDHSRRKTHYSVFGNKNFVVKEDFSNSQRMNELNEGILMYNISGEIDDMNLNEWQMEAGRMGINIENSVPKLDLYEGIYCINLKTSTLEKAKIKLVISFGKSFKREQTYSLLLLNDKEIDDL